MDYMELGGLCSGALCCWGEEEYGPTRELWLGNLWSVCGPGRYMRQLRVLTLPGCCSRSLGVGWQGVTQLCSPILHIWAGRCEGPWIHFFEADLLESVLLFPCENTGQKKKHEGEESERREGSLPVSFVYSHPSTSKFSVLFPHFLR